MVLINRVFAEKHLHFCEWTNKLLELLYKLPRIGEAVKKQAEEKESKPVRIAVGVAAQIFLLLTEFVRRLFFALAFLYLPYRVLASFCPLVDKRQEPAVIYLFFVIITVCGTIVNTTLMKSDDRDYLMVKVYLVKPAVHFLVKIADRMLKDFLCFWLILMIFGLSPLHALCLSAATALLRPLGEVVAVLMYEKFRFLYNNRNMYYGCIMAVSMIVAYGMPIVTRTVTGGWYAAVHPGFTGISFVIGFLSMLILWNYRRYRRLLADTMDRK